MSTYSPTGTVTTAPPRKRPGTTPNVPRMPLSRRLRRTTLIVHIVSGGAWIGIDVIVAVLVLLGWFSGDVQLRSLAYQALATFVVWPMLISGLVCLASGLVLGLATKWRLLRYWWVVVKLVANVVLVALIPIALAPGMGDVAQYGRDLLTGTPDDTAVVTLFFPPTVSLTTLVVATALAVFKPWGRTKRRATGRIERAVHDQSTPARVAQRVRDW